MRLDDKLKSEIQSAIILAHKRSKKEKIYLWEIRSQLFKMAERFTEPGFIEARKISNGLNQIVASSKANNYQSKQFLKLLSNMVEGFARDYQKELLRREQEKSENNIT